MQELSLQTARRGMRIVTGHDFHLGGEFTGTEAGYRGTIVEITSQIPSGLEAGKPGVRVVFDHLPDSSQARTGISTPGEDSFYGSGILSAEEALLAEAEQPQWMAFKA